VSGTLLAPGHGRDPHNLLHEPDVGYVGGDATLLDLNRAFNTEPVVLLHGLAGAGKTATAAEFARWYVRTGGDSRGARGETWRGRGAAENRCERFARDEARTATSCGLGGAPSGIAA
jgi:signal recognition particle GTPase